MKFSWKRANWSIVPWNATLLWLSMAKKAEQWNKNSIFERKTKFFFSLRFEKQIFSMKTRRAVFFREFSVSRFQRRPDRSSENQFWRNEKRKFQFFHRIDRRSSKIHWKRSISWWTRAKLCSERFAQSNEESSVERRENREKYFLLDFFVENFQWKTFHRRKSANFAERKTEIRSKLRRTSRRILGQPAVRFQPENFDVRNFDRKEKVNLRCDWRFHFFVEATFILLSNIFFWFCFVKILLGLIFQRSN